MADEGEPAFRRDEVLGGLPARRASMLLFAIERRTAVLARQSIRSLASYESPRNVEEQDRALMEALAAGRDEPERPSAQQLERHAPRWADLVPPDPAVRAALASRIGASYRLTRGGSPRIRAALHLDDPSVIAAYERRNVGPMAAIWQASLTPRERIDWARARSGERLESLPPFWMAFALTFTETVGAGILALPVAFAGMGVVPALVILVVLGLINLLTVGALVEAIVRNGSMRYGTSYFGNLVGELLGRPAALILRAALLALSVVALFALFIAFASVLQGATGLPAGFWVAGLLMVDVLIVRRGRLDATIATALVIGATNIVLITVIALLAVPHIDPANLAYASVPLLDGDPLDPALLGLVFGVVLIAYFGHTSAANAAKVVLTADLSGRSLLWGNLAAFLAVISLYALTVTAILGAVGPEALTGFEGTALTPLAEVVGPAVSVLGSLFTILAVGLGSVYFALGLHNQVIELLPSPPPDAQHVDPLGSARRLARDARLRLALGLAPAVLVAIVAEILLAAGSASFTESLAIIGVLTLPLLAGVIPMLLLVAARRRGEYVPGRTLVLAGNPIVVSGVCAFFVMGVFVHALVIWQEPIEQATALVVGVVMVLLIVRIVTSRAFRPRSVLEVLRGGRFQTDRYQLVSRGTRLDTEFAVSPGAVSASLPPEAERELLVWAHRVGPGGGSMGLAGNVRIGPAVGQPGAAQPDGAHPSGRLRDGRSVVILPPGPVVVEVTLDGVAATDG